MVLNTHIIWSYIKNIFKNTDKIAFKEKNCTFPFKAIRIREYKSIVSQGIIKSLKSANCLKMFWNSNFYNFYDVYIYNDISKLIFWSVTDLQRENLCSLLDLLNKPLDNWKTVHLVQMNCIVMSRSTKLIRQN